MVGAALITDFEKRAGFDKKSLVRNVDLALI